MKYANYRQPVAVQTIKAANDELYLFPPSISSKMCKKIGYLYSEDITMQDNQESCGSTRSLYHSNGMHFIRQQKVLQIFFFTSNDSLKTKDDLSLK